MAPKNKTFDGSSGSKLLVGIAVFVAVFGGWLAFLYASSVREADRIAHSPLPETSGSRQACMIWFVGSSSMHNWKTLDRDMAPWDARNRGIGGATMDEITMRFGNDEPGPAPRAIIYYAGENDIAFGIPAGEAIDKLGKFIEAKRRRLGNVPLLVISLKPSPTRWNFRTAQQEFNAAAHRIADDQDDVDYIDIVPKLLINGRPGPFYVKDGIHMNAAGYALWATAIRAELPHAVPIETLRRCGAVKREKT
ncbi:lysophospholipase [Sphingomonas sp. JC676]|uniref:GDSL-type esterase/lipase family protein n=1 Tax=Sphingomonas sp. JC676 TaxID=2768065 RepID=UPI001657716E|nr:GDSL-type esterase/lipase family protein [Sphingomonas sp. JC676]MBC9031277.1 lysophospholipase [Sphingomonas sp. JC676]